MQLFKGTFIDTPTVGSLRIRRDHLMAVTEEGSIVHIAPLTASTSTALLSSSPSSSITDLTPHSCLTPTFVDLHLHAPQYLYAGTGLDLPLMEWLDRYAYKAEERIDGDPDLAGRVYRRLVRRLREVGTGCVVFFGTIGVGTNLILAKACLEAGIRAYVGKLSMDHSPRPSYGEPSVLASLSSLHSFLDGMDSLVSPLPSHRQLVKPIITPRFVPVCSDELLSELAKVSKERGVRVQSHMCESRDQMDWVEGQRGKKDEDVFDGAGLLMEGTVQAHVTSLPGELIGLCRARGVTAAHCPLSNAYFSDAQFPLREAIDAEMSVGLGSDVAGGYSLSIQSAMRQAIVTSRLREGQRREAGAEVGARSLRVDWVESLYLATRGGKQALGLGGAFEVGMEFDAQLLELGGEDSPVDFFPLPKADEVDDVWWTEAVERWWCNGDERNRKGMWVQGSRVF